MKQTIALLKNFGFAGENKVLASDINGTMIELQVAVGTDAAIGQRAAVAAIYREQIEPIEGLSCPMSLAALWYNNAYVPIMADANYPLSGDPLDEMLKQDGIYRRRHFYPLATNIPMRSQSNFSAREQLPWVHQIARQVICSSISSELTLEKRERIIRVLRE